ncbi:MAG: hypothetical protein ACE5GV_14570 [Candidatus Scalindua sp.]
MSQLINGQFKAMKVGIKHKNQNISDKELEQWLKTRLRKIYMLETIS